MTREQKSSKNADVIDASVAVPTEAEMLHRIGQMTRGLHESLRELGLDKKLEKTALEIPDARDRLNYIATMTEQAAERVLNATDIASPLQNKIGNQAEELQEKWEAILAKPSLKPEYNEVAQETLEYLKQTAENANATKAQLLEIMMAQDFQDLTGQVIKKVTEVANTIEQELVRTLVDFAPNKPVAEPEEEGLLNGPQIKPEEKVNVMADQEQVDDLLDSLGF